MTKRRQTRNSASTTSSTGEFCLLCKLIVKENDACAVACEYCQGWVHSKCIGVDTDTFAAVANLDNFKYFCTGCLPKLDRLLTLEKRIDDLEARFISMEGNIHEKSSVLTDHGSSQIQASGVRNNQLPARDISQVIEETIEFRLKQRNAVLFGVPESDDDLAAVRQLLLTPCHDEAERVNPQDVQYVFRDGTKHADQPRFLKVICATSQVKQDFIKFINRVVKPNVAATNPHLRSRPDLTYRQRVDGRTLREKLKQFGDGTHFINYAKRVIVRKADRQTVFSLPQID